MARINVAAPGTPTEAQWVRLIGEACGWKGEIVIAPAESLPPTMRSPLAVRQDLVVSSDRIRAELGYAEHVPLEEGLRRPVAWTRANPPEHEPLDDSIEEPSAPSRRDVASRPVRRHSRTLAQATLESRGLLYATPEREPLAATARPTAAPTMTQALWAGSPQNELDPRPLR